MSDTTSETAERLWVSTWTAMRKTNRAQSPRADLYDGEVAELTTAALTAVFDDLHMWRPALPGLPHEVERQVTAALEQYADRLITAMKSGVPGA